MSERDPTWDDDPIARLLPGITAAALMDEPDVLRVEHGPLERLPGLTELAALGSVARILRRAPNAVVSAWNIDWNIRDPEKSATGLDLRVNVETGIQFFERGAVLYVDHIEDAFPEFVSTRNAIEAALGVSRDRCKLELVASIGGTGAAMHFDPDYAFNVQILGSKRWSVAANEQVRHPLAGATANDVPRSVSRHAHAADFPTRMPADARTFEARPGSVVWVPRGWWHATEVLGEGESLSLCFALKVPTAAQDFAARMMHHLAREPAWRKPLFGSAGGLAARRAYTANIEALFAAMLAEQPRALVDRVMYDLPADWADATLEPVMTAVAQLHARDEGVALVVETDTHRTELHLDGDAASLSPIAYWLCERRTPFAVAEAAALAARLDREGPQPAPFVIDDVVSLLAGCVQAGLFERRIR